MSQINNEIATIRRMASLAAMEDTARDMAVTLLCSLRVIPADGDFYAVARVVQSFVETDCTDVALQRLKSSVAARWEESDQEVETVLGTAMLSVIEGLLIWHAMMAQMKGMPESAHRKGCRHE